MADFMIYLGNKNYSSWSLRPWLVLKQTGVAFEEVVIPLYEPTSKATIMKYSPSGTVPALRHGELDVVQLFEPYAEELIDSGDGHVWYAAATFKERCGLGRNVTIQILEYLDKMGATRRTGDARIVLRGSEVFA